MAGDIFSRFRAPEAVESDGAGRAFEWTGGLAQVQETEIIDAIGRVPDLPRIAGQVLASAGDGPIQAADLERAIGLDPELSGKVMRLINRIFCRRPQPVGSLGEAAAAIGPAGLRCVALAASTSHLLLADLQPYGMVRGGLWRNAIATASVSRQIGIRGGAGPDLSEEFFAAALLRDVGLTIISPFLARSGIRLRREPGRDLLAAERRAVGFDHGWVGDRLAERWRLPAPLRACIGRHHRDPGGDGGTGARHLGAVRLAERLVFAAGVGVLPDHPFDIQIEARIVKSSGLDAVSFAAVCAEVPHLVRHTDPPE